MMQLATLRKRAEDFIPTGRKDYSQHIMPLKLNVALPERLAAAFEHPELGKYADLSGDKYGELISMSDRLSAYHYANVNTAILLKIVEGGTYELESDFSVDTAESVRVELAENVKAKLFMRISSTAFHSQFLEIFLEKDAELTLAILQDKPSGTFIGKQAVRLADNSKLRWLHADIGSDISIVEQSVLLEGKSAKSRNYMIGIKDDAQRIDCDLRSIHTGKAGDSDIDSALVLEGRAQGTVRALVQINKDASDSKGFQKQETLMLSEDCKANAVPDLVIRNNEVQCSHSASISRIDKGSKFYIMSRGMDEESAMKMLRDGFIRSHLLKIGDEELIQRFREALGI